MKLTIFETQWFRIVRLGLALVVSAAPVWAQRHKLVQGNVARLYGLALPTPLAV